MKKIFTLISVALVAMGVNAQTESYSAITNSALSSEYAAVVGSNGVATNVSNGSSKVNFSTTNVTVEAVGSSDPADLAGGGQDITIGNLISEADHTYELVSINSTKDIKWEAKNQGDIDFWYVAGTGTPAVSMVAEEIFSDGTGTGTYRVKVTAFDPATGGEPASGLYYKITTAVDGALKVGIWANKGNRTTFLVDGETKQAIPYLVEGYINGQNYSEDDVTAGKATAEQVGKKKWLTNDEIVALRSASNSEWVIGAGNQNFWGNVIIDAKAGKTYWLFQGNSQIGFQGYTFAPGKTKEELVTGIESVKVVAAADNNVDAPIYNLAGQKVSKNYKGVVVQNGKKFVQK